MCRIVAFAEFFNILCGRMVWSCRGLWQLATGVYLAHVGSGSGAEHYAIVFDTREIKFREKNAKGGDASLKSLVHEVDTKRAGDDIPVRAFQLNSCFGNLVNFGNAPKYASQLLVKIDDSEVDWFIPPEEITITPVMQKAVMR
jgi:hypothetical protein